MRGKNYFGVLLGLLMVWAAAASCMSTGAQVTDDPLQIVVEERYVKWSQYDSSFPIEKTYYKVLWSRTPSLSYPAEREDVRVWAFDHLDNLEAWIEPFAGSGVYYVRIAVVHEDQVLDYSKEIATEMVAPDPDPPAGEEGPRIDVSVQGNLLTFTPYGVFPQGFKVLWSQEPNPEYPPREGDYANYVGPFNERESWLWTEDQPGMYYLRVAEYLGEEGIGISSETILVEIP